MDIKVEQDDLNQKFLTSLAPEWLMHNIVWRNRNDLDTMSLDDLYNHLKIDEDDMEEINIKWSMALLSIRAYKFCKKTGKKISIQGFDVAGFDKSKVECFNCHKMGHFARECRVPRSQEIGRKDNYRQGSKSEEKTLKALMAIDGVGWDWSYIENEGEYHALRSDKIKDGVGYSAVPPPVADLYLSPKKDLSWTGLPEFFDDTVTDYSRTSPTIESTSEEECFNCHKMGHFARECKAPSSQDRGRRDNYRQGSKVEEQAPKELMVINEVGWDWNFMKNEEKDHALVADEETPTEFALIAKPSADSEVFDNSLCSKTYKKNTDSLNSKITELIDKLSDIKTTLYHYKLGLS
nr:ribonuclease H-like domain-containing protein [Tanacetum cinerariifolium]